MSAIVKAIVYARFSKADQIKGHSIDRQLDHIRMVCSANGYAITPDLTYVEQGKSAFSGANRAKGSLLAKLETEISIGIHTGKVLVVEHLDRISRQGHDEVTDFLRSCSKGGVSVATYDGSRFFAAGAPLPLMEVIEVILKAELARAESANKSFRVQRSFEAKRKAAVENGEKNIASRPPSWIRRLPDRKGFELIEDRAQIVREAHRLIQNGYGTAAIAKIFNDRGYRPWRSKSIGWHESYISRMLTMRTAIGEYKSDKHGDRIIDYYPPVVSVETFNLTQIAKAKRSNNGGGRRGSAQANLFAGFVRCDHCSGPMHLQPTREAGKIKKRNYKSGNKGATKIYTKASYYKCSHNQRRVTVNGNRLCRNSRSIRYENIEPVILDRILQIAIDDRFDTPEITDTRQKLAEADRQLEHKKEQANNIAANLTESVSPTLVAMLDAIQTEIQLLTEHHNTLSKALMLEQSSQPSSAFLSRIKATRDAMESKDLDVRRDARVLINDSLKYLISEIRCDQDANTMVIVANGLAAFQLDRAGKIAWRYDASNDPQAIRALTTEAYADNASTVDAIIRRARTINAEKDNRGD